MRLLRIDDIANAVRSTSYIMLTVSVPLTLKLLVVLLFVQIFASRALSHCKHDMGALSWLNAETLERVPTMLSGMTC